MKYKLELQCFFSTDTELPTGITFGDKAITDFLHQIESIKFEGSAGTEPLFKMTMEKVEE